MRTRWGSSKEFSAWGDGPTMCVCLAAAKREPHVMLCRNTGTVCLCGALLTSCRAVHQSQQTGLCAKYACRLEARLLVSPANFIAWTLQEGHWQQAQYAPTRMPISMRLSLAGIPPGILTGGLEGCTAETQSLLGNHMSCQHRQKVTSSCGLSRSSAHRAYLQGKMMAIRILAGGGCS